MSRKKTMNIYMDTQGIYYTVMTKKEKIRGKTVFDSLEELDYTERIKRMVIEMTNLRKKNKVKINNIIITEGIRLVKVIDFEKEIKLNADTEILLKEELTKYLQPSESINDYDMHYLKTGKKTQSVFLVALIQRKPTMEICTLAIHSNLNIGQLVIPEIAMYTYLKEKEGINVIAVYDPQNYELRTLVTRGEDMLYASQIKSVTQDDIEGEVEKLKEHIYTKLRVIVNSTTLVGIPIEDEEDTRYKLVENIS